MQFQVAGGGTGFACLAWFICFGVRSFILISYYQVTNRNIKLPVIRAMVPVQLHSLTSEQSSSMVDRRIVTKLLCTFFERGQSKEVLGLMARMLVGGTCNRVAFVISNPWMVALSACMLGHLQGGARPHGAHAGGWRGGVHCV